MEIILNRKVVFEGQSEELYGSYPWRKFLTKKEIERDDEECDVDVYTDSYTDSDSKDIPIEDIKALIQKAEDAGANYIQIDYHCDHEEYEIYGSHISRKTKKEVDKYNKVKSVSEKMKKMGKIRALEAELKNLKNEVL